MRWVLLGATGLLAALVVVASPLGRVLDPAIDPDGKPLSLSLERRCSDELPTDPWRRSFADRLERWVKAVRGSSGAPGDEADSPRAESLRLTDGAARATLEAYFLLKAAGLASTPARLLKIEDVRVHLCPGRDSRHDRPLWEIRWQEDSGPAEPERWLALVAIEELDLSAETHLAHPEGFVVTDFDWGRDPADPGAAAP